MKKNYFRTASIIGLASLCLSFNSCDDENNNDETALIKSYLNVSADVEGSVSASDIAGATVTFTNTRSKDVYTFKVPAGLENGEGSILIAVPVGVYDISLEKEIDGKTIFIRKQNVTVKSDNQQIDAKLIATVANLADYQFIFSEVFFNGERNAGRMMHPDQYMVLYNPTDKVLYADGLAVGCTMQNSNGEKKSWFDQYYGQGNVPVHGIIVIPGSGYEHPVKPHDKIVIAFTAINHHETEGKYADVNEKGDTTWVSFKYENAVDLSGADFEIYDPQLYTSDVDNPEVPNVREIYPAESDLGGFGGFYQHPRGFNCPFIFKLENGEQSTLDAFFKEHSSVANVKDEDGNNVEIQMLSVPASMILDGITTGHIPTGIVTNPLPLTVDRGEQLVKGCHSGLLVRRKGSDEKGYADTNNSSEDCEIVEEHHAFPSGWRH